MADEKVLKVFHAARQISKSSGTSPAHSAPDLRYASAAMVLGMASCLRPLVERITGHRPDRTHRFTDWSRPAADPKTRCITRCPRHHLRDVFHALDADLKKRGRKTGVSEEMEVLTRPRPTTFHPERAWERLKTGVASPRSLPVADGGRGMARTGGASATFRAAAF